MAEAGMADLGELSRAARPVEAGGEVRIAFQPILDLSRGSVYAYEALARRPGGISAAEVFEGLKGHELSRMERRLVWEAMAAAARSRLPGFLCINLGSTLLGNEAALSYLTELAARAGLSPGRVILEFPEHLPIDVPAWVASHKLLRAAGFRTALDDLGAGYASLSVLAAYVPDVVKLDMRLVQGLSDSAQRVRRKVVAHVAAMALDLGAEVVAEGVETADDAEALLKLGIYLQQGYLHGRPTVPLDASGGEATGAAERGALVP
jgi:EAL domain-containing protein (putative c-di-GMP-specific phosphodiesterase class I)